MNELLHKLGVQYKESGIWFLYQNTQSVDIQELRRLMLEIIMLKHILIGLKKGDYLFTIY